MRFRKILAIKLRSLGDTVLMSAPISKLRELYPQSEIHVLATDPWCQVLERHPGIDKLIPYTRREEKIARARMIARLALTLRREKYDLVIAFHASPSSATLAFATGAPVRSVHFHGHKDRNRHSTVEIPGKGEAKSIIERDLDAIRALPGAGRIPPSSVMPQVYLSNEEVSFVKSRFYSAMSKSPTLVLSLGASRPTKIWPLEKFAELAKLWVNDTDGRVLIIRAPGEEGLLTKLLSLLPSSMTDNGEVVALPLLSIREVASIIQLANVFVGNDSGPKHLAVAVGTPTVTLIGPEDPQEWHPYSMRIHKYLHIPGLGCRRDALPGMPPWCGLYECFVEKHRCMEAISVQETFHVVKEITR